MLFARNDGPLPADALRQAVGRIRGAADRALARQKGFQACPTGFKEFEWELEQGMIDALRQTFPGVPVLAEEFFTEHGELVGNDGTLRFVLDPIDGSASYLTGSPLFAVSLAICEGDRLLGGFVYQPATGDVFHAVAGQGAFIGKRHLRLADVGPSRTVSVRSTMRADPLVDRLIESVTDRGFWVEDRMWCSSLKICWIATGARAAVVKRLSRRAGRRTWWGTAAGLLVAQEAGARAVQLDGTVWEGQDGDLLIADPRLLTALEAH